MRHTKLNSEVTGQTLFEIQDDNWLTTKDAASYLRVSEKTLLNLCSQGKIKYAKLGRRNRYLQSDLKKLLLAQTRGGFPWE